MSASRSPRDPPETHPPAPTGRSPFRLDGQTALITGGGSGLGLAIARAMAEAGARVALVGRREPPLKQAAEQIGPTAGYYFSFRSGRGITSRFHGWVGVAGNSTP